MISFSCNRKSEMLMVNHRHHFYWWSLLWGKIVRNFAQCTWMVPNAQSSVPINYSNAKNNRKLQDIKAFASMIKNKLCRTSIHRKLLPEKKTKTILHRQSFWTIVFEKGYNEVETVKCTKKCDVVWIICIIRSIFKRIWTETLQYFIFWIFTLLSGPFSKQSETKV